MLCFGHYIALMDISYLGEAVFEAAILFSSTYIVSTKLIKSWWEAKMKDSFMKIQVQDEPRLLGQKKFASS